MLSERCRVRIFALGGLLLNLVFGGGLTAIAQQAEVIATQRDSSYQAVLENIAKATSRTGRLQQIDNQLTLWEQDCPKLVSQVLWYAAQKQGDPSSRGVVGLVLKQLNIPKHLVVAALVPHLDERDEGIRRVTQNLLAGYEDQSVERPPDFSAYRGIIEADVLAGRAPQASLVRRMYTIDPGSALIAMMRAYQVHDPEAIKSIRWTEHVVAELLWKRRYGFADATVAGPEAVAELEKLSRHDAWWARLYVAQVVAQHSELGSASLIMRLAGDANPLVRESVQVTAGK